MRKLTLTTLVILFMLGMSTSLAVPQTFPEPNRGERKTNTSSIGMIDDARVNAGDDWITKNPDIKTLLVNFTWSETYTNFSKIDTMLSNLPAEYDVIIRLMVADYGVTHNGGSPGYYYDSAMPYAETTSGYLDVQAPGKPAYCTARRVNMVSKASAIESWARDFAEEYADDVGNHAKVTGVVFGTGVNGEAAPYPSTSGEYLEGCDNSEWKAEAAKYINPNTFTYSYWVPALEAIAEEWAFNDKRIMTGLSSSYVEGEIGAAFRDRLQEHAIGVWDSGLDPEPFECRRWGSQPNWNRYNLWPNFILSGLEYDKTFGVQWMQSSELLGYPAASGNEQGGGGQGQFPDLTFAGGWQLNAYRAASVRSDTIGYWTDYKTGSNPKPGYEYIDKDVIEFSQKYLGVPPTENDTVWIVLKGRAPGAGTYCPNYFNYPYGITSDLETGERWTSSHSSTITTRSAQAEYNEPSSSISDYRYYQAREVTDLSDILLDIDDEWNPGSSSEIRIDYLDDDSGTIDIIYKTSSTQTKTIQKTNTDTWKTYIFSVSGLQVDNDLSATSYYQITSPSTLVTHDIRIENGGDGDDVLHILSVTNSGGGPLPTSTPTTTPTTAPTAPAPESITEVWYKTEDSGYAQTHPDIAWNSTDNTVGLVWEDGRNDPGGFVDTYGMFNNSDPCFRRYNSSGTALGTEICWGGGEYGSTGRYDNETFPAITYDANDNDWAYNWMTIPDSQLAMDVSSPSQMSNGTCYDIDHGRANNIGSQETLATDLAYYTPSNPLPDDPWGNPYDYSCQQESRIETFTSNMTLSVWHDHRERYEDCDGTYCAKDIYAQVVTGSTKQTIDAVLISHGTTSSDRLPFIQEKPDIAGNESKWLVVWEDERDANYAEPIPYSTTGYRDIYGRFLTRSGTSLVLGSEVLLAQGSLGVYKYLYPRVAYMSGADKYVVLMNRYYFGSGIYQLFYMVVDSSGNIVKELTQIPGTTGLNSALSDVACAPYYCASVYRSPVEPTFAVLYSSMRASEWIFSNEIAGTTTGRISYPHITYGESSGTTHDFYATYVMGDDIGFSKVSVEGSGVPTPTATPTKTNTPGPGATSTPTNTPTATPTPTSQPQGGGSDTFDASWDTYIHTWYPTTNYNSSIAVVVRSSNVQNGIIKFDVSSIPSDVTITSATLKMYPYTVRYTETDQNVDVYALAKDANETQSTWNLAKTGTSWTTPGANSAGNDYVNELLDTVAIEQNVWAEWDVTAAVEDWANGTTTNYGFLLTTEDNNADYTYFRSENTVQTSEHPVLEVIWTGDNGTPPAGTATPTPVYVGTIQPDASYDTYINDYSKDTVYDTSWVLNARASASAPVTKVLIKFDISDIPENAPITSATLNMYVYDERYTDSTMDINVYALATDWTTGNTTWNNKNPSVAWSTPGAAHAGTDYINTVIDTETVSGVGQWESWDVTSLVEDWVDGTLTNHGMILYATSDANGDWKYFYSSEETTIGTLNPYLTVSWSIPTPTPTVTPPPTSTPTATPSIDVICEGGNIVPDPILPDGTVNYYIDSVSNDTTEYEIKYFTDYSPTGITCSYNQIWCSLASHNATSNIEFETWLTYNYNSTNYTCKSSGWVSAPGDGAICNNTCDADADIATPTPTPTLVPTIVPFPTNTPKVPTPTRVPISIP